MGRSAPYMVVAVLLLAPTFARAYDVEVHYAWTYYLALHSGYTARQAFQVASATVGIDGDLDTEPLQGVGAGHVLFGASSDEVFRLYSVGPLQLTPSHRIVNVWSHLHAFAENQYVSSGRMLPATPPSEAEVALVPDVQAAREEHQRALWTIALAERNPGPFLHFLQDSFAHGPYDNLRGHALHGHAPDFLSHRPSLSWQMTLRTLQALREFLPRVGGTARTADTGRIREVFDGMLAANPRRWAVNPTLYDAALPGSASIAGVGSPSATAAWRVVSQAVDEDHASGRLTPFPEVWFSERPPVDWLQYDFAADGRAPPGGVNANRYAVEQVRVTLGEPTASFAPAAGSSTGAQQVTLRVSYTLAGLADLPFLSPLPVIERAAVSDFPEARRQTAERSNGTFTIERQIQRSAAALRDGTLRWTVTVQPYGLEPTTTTLTLRLDRPGLATPPSAQCSGVLGTWQWGGGVATFAGDASGGSASATDNPHVSSGRWRCTGPDQIEISWNGGRFIDRMHVARDAMTGTNQRGYAVHARRARSGPSSPTPARTPAAALPETCTWHASTTMFPAACVCRRSDGISFTRPRVRCGR